MFKIIKELLGLDTINDDWKTFKEQYPVAQLIIYEYLFVWFKQIFESEEYKRLHFSQDFHKVMAARVTNYLLGKDKAISNQADKNKIEDIKFADQYMDKWSNDVMERDKDLAKFVVYTIRLYMIFKMYVIGTEEFQKSEEGKRIFNLLTKYGKIVPEEPKFWEYRKLIIKWISWSEAAKKKGLLN